LHFPDFGGQVAKRGVGVAVARVYHGLQSYHAFAFHFAQTTVRFPDYPMTPEQFYGIRTGIFDGNVVSENVLVFARLRMSGQELRIDHDRNAVRRKDFHVSGAKREVEMINGFSRRYNNPKTSFGIFLVLKRPQIILFKRKSFF
jgi:hypothetical protein